MRFKIGRRLLYLGIGVAAFLVAYSAGAAVPMSDEEAQQTRDQFEDLIQDIDEIGIFVNNFSLSLAMFIPALGAGFGAFTGFQTGNVYAAFANESPLLAQISPLAIFILPHGIMEVFVYGLAMSRSGMLVYYMVKKRPWREYVKPTLIELGIAAGVLFAAALVEWWTIEQLGGLDSATITTA